MLDGAAPVLERTLRIPITDRGFLYGEAAFETMIAEVDGEARVDALAAHLARLGASSAAFGVAEPGPALRGDLRRLLAALGPGRYRVRAVVTAGEGGRLDGAGAAPGHRIVSARALRAYPERLYVEGASAVLQRGAASVVPGAKLVSYAGNAAAVRAARRAGAHEALFVSETDEVLEGATSNIFTVYAGALRTPSVERILGGITRAQVMRLARAEGLPVREEPLPLTSLRGAEEAFLTSSIRGVMPLTGLEGRPLGEGVPGPWTRRLAAAWHAEASDRLETV